MSHSEHAARRTPLTLYGHRLSGHCHRVELLLSLLGLPYGLVEVDLAAGAHKQPGFLEMNPFGQVPVLQDDDITLADSNAILVYLATRYDAGHWLPRDPVGAARVQRWLSIAAGPIAFGPAAARLINVFGAPYRMEEVAPRALELFAVMEAWLARSAFLAAPHATIADIACYSYIARAPEGGISLVDYPHLRAWLARIEALPDFTPMAASPVGLAA